jgi:hypothetical protein
MADISFKYHTCIQKIDFCYKRDNADKSEVEGVITIKEYADGTYDRDIEYFDDDVLTPEELELLLERLKSSNLTRIMNSRPRIEVNH